MSTATIARRGHIIGVLLSQNLLRNRVDNTNAPRVHDRRYQLELTPAGHTELQYWAGVYAKAVGRETSVSANHRNIAIPDPGSDSVSSVGASSD